MISKAINVQTLPLQYDHERVERVIRSIATEVGSRLVEVEKRLPAPAVTQQGAGSYNRESPPPPVKGPPKGIPEEAAELIREPRKYIIRSQSELANDTDCQVLRGQPYWDPKLRRCRSAKVEFLAALSRAGLLTMRRRVRCRVGCFFVNKMGCCAS